MESCAHCLLPVGPLGSRHDIHGEARWFCCYGCSLAYRVHHDSHEEPQAAAWLIRLGVGAFLAMNIMTASLLLYAGAFRGEDAWLVTPVHWLLWLLATPLLATLGAPFIGGAWRGLRQRRLSTDTLVAVGTLAAYGYSAVQVLRDSHLVYFDTVSMVLLLFTLGRYLEAQARARAARSLAPMLAAERAQACIVAVDGSESLRPVLAVLPGELVRIRPGERVPVDGVVVEGRSACEESVITGQPAPQSKCTGSAVLAGSLNGNGMLLVRASVAGTQTRWLQISRLVREALATKTLAGDTVERVVAFFIPGVLLLAVAAGAYWGQHSGVEAALLAGLAVLVVACPCSLGLAAPLAGTLAIGQAAQRGILVRGGGVLERLAKLKGVAFDKTGTLTLDTLQVAALRCEGASRDEVLHLGGSLAQGSRHPAACAISRAAHAMHAGGPGLHTPAGLQAQPGAGVQGHVGGVHAALGSAAFLHSLGWGVPASLATGSEDTAVLVGWGGQARGRFTLQAQPLPEAAEVVAALRGRGLHALLLSGDGTAAVQALAGRLGLAHWHAELSPEDKLALLRRWAQQHGPMAMVGDGQNDGPVLAAAAVGIAVGGAEDLAKESADIVLPRGGLGQLPWLLQQAATLRRSVRANIAWAFGYNAVALTLAACGLLQPVIAAALMAGSSIVVSVRSWRAQQRAARAEEPAPISARAAALPAGTGTQT